MAQSSNEFKHESLQDNQSIVKYLEAIKDGFENGKLTLANGDSREMVLEPAGLLNLELKARSKDGRYKLSFKISWKEKEETPEVDTKPLTIEAMRD